MKSRPLCAIALLCAACGNEIYNTDTRPLPVCINEFMPDNGGALLDDGGHFNDWIELHNPGKAAVDLSGYTLTSDPQNPGQSPLPDGFKIPPYEWVVLWADGLPPTKSKPNHVRFWLPNDGGVLGLFAPDGRGDLITYGKVSTDFAVARHPDCCTGASCFGFDYHGTPGRSNIPTKTTPVTLLAPGGPFRYLDTNIPPPANWTRADYDDSAWKTGRAPLGYGDAHIITTVNGGADPANHYITTWFRTTFTATNPRALLNAKVTLLRDDGAAVYLNGVEIGRSNLPAGPLTPATLAPTGASGADETTYYDLPIPLDKLLDGKNTLAIEVHQAAANSSDLGMDCGVVGEKAE